MKRVPIPDKQIIETCDEAIQHVANRIRADEKVAYLLGYGSQSFRLVSEASAALNSTTVEHAQDYMLGRCDDIQG